MHLLVYTKFPQKWTRTYPPAQNHTGFSTSISGPKYFSCCISLPICALARMLNQEQSSRNLNKIPQYGHTGICLFAFKVIKEKKKKLKGCAKCLPWFFVFWERICCFKIDFCYGPWIWIAVFVTSAVTKAKIQNKL